MKIGEESMIIQKKIHERETGKGGRRKETKERKNKEEKRGSGVGKRGG